MITTVTVFRTAMIGGGLAYDVYVRLSDLPPRDYGTITIREDQNGKRQEWIPYDMATVPDEISTMPKGWDRYDAFMAHVKQANVEALALARRVFPELQGYDDKGRGLPELWVTGLMPREHESHSVRTVRLTKRVSV